MSVTYTGDGATAINSLKPSSISFTPSLPGTVTISLVGSGSYNVTVVNTNVTNATNAYQTIPTILGIYYMTSATTALNYTTTPTWAGMSAIRTLFASIGVTGPPVVVTATGSLQFSSASLLPTSGGATFIPGNTTQVTPYRIYFYLLF
jgi:hypothetical protein